MLVSYGTRTAERGEQVGVTGDWWASFICLVTCARRHFDCTKESLPVLQVHHLTLDLILNHVNKCQLRDNALSVEYRRWLARFFYLLPYSRRTYALISHRIT